jgi:hypothetical protein
MGVLASVVPDQNKAWTTFVSSREQKPYASAVFSGGKIVTKIVCQGIGQCRDFDVQANTALGTAKVSL